MYRFTYIYQGVTHESTAEHCVQEGNQCYLITLANGLVFAIAAAAIGKTNDKIIWVQSNKYGEPDQPHDLAQAVGEGLDIVLRKLDQP